MTESDPVIAHNRFKCSGDQAEKHGLTAPVRTHADSVPHILVVGDEIEGCRFMVLNRMKDRPQYPLA